MHNNISWFLLAFIILISCNDQTQDSKNIFDGTFLPEGVNTIPHQIYKPDGSNFSKPRVDPHSWWIGMQTDTIDLLVYNQSIADCNVELLGQGLNILNQRNLENPNYKIVTLHISENAIPGEYDLAFLCADEKPSLKFRLWNRQNNTNRIDPVNDSDIMYLIMPDRFANGDTLNDSFEDMRQTGIHRDKIYFRHGGDIQGIIDHLDYLQDLGITSLWLNPVQENDMPYSSYHGYAITDLYNVDKRFGNNELYRTLADSLEARGMKLVMDIIPNHCGSFHYFIQDIPTSDWIHQFDKFQHSIHSHPTPRDPYVSESDRTKHYDGWFDYSMPDLNQSNPDLAKYLIQNYIWWVEYAGLDGYRIDTYQYVDQPFMHQMNREILEEYPGLHIFAENWTYDRALQAQYVSGSALQEDFESYLPATADFQWCFSVKETCGKKANWGEGVQKLHYTYASHYLYDSPEKNVIFLDNHDMDRFYSYVNEDWNAFESGLNILMTSPGIPCLYYGTELLHKYYSHPDGQVRLDMKGGWEEDPENHFEPIERPELVNKTYNTVKRLTDLRHKSTAIAKGQFKHYAPSDFVYSYFRTMEGHKIQFILNGSDFSKTVELERYSEDLQSVTKGVNIHNNKLIEYPSTLELAPKQSMVIEWEIE